jgi:hypothetical protein
MIAFYTPAGIRVRKLMSLGSNYLSMLASKETEMVILIGFI